MVEKFYNKIHTSILLIIVLYFFIFFGISSNGVEEESRIDRILLIFIVGIFSFYALYVVFYFNRKNEVKKVNNRILFFIILWFLSAILFLNYGAMTRVTSYLPTILFVLLSFYYFLYISDKKYITDKILIIFTVLVFLVVSYNFYQTLTYKRQILGDNYFKHSNNAGYGFVVIIPLLIYSFRKHKLLLNTLLIIAYLCILFSSKRGAILVGTILLGVYIYNFINKQKSSINKIVLSIVTVLVLVVFSFFISDNIDNIIHRFDQKGGSGRDLIYEAILENILEGNFFQLIFGHGFFSTSDITKRVLGQNQMAHSDFLEVLHDLGLLGLFVYCAIYFSFIKIYFALKKINKEDAFVLLLCLLLWIMKMSMSGVIMAKDCIFIFITMGIVIGRNYKQLFRKV